MTGILDYGAGNLRSVQKAFEFLGEKAVITSDEDILNDCEHLILPGVGAFGQGMKALKNSGLDNYIRRRKQDTPILGICLGMQFLMSKSYENGENEGLNFCNGDVVRFTEGKVPEIGWNHVYNLKSPLFENIKDDSEFYFVHSYYAGVCENTIATSDYGTPFSAAVKSGNNIYGVQFHPEKSGETGLKLLSNFLNIRGIKE